MKYRYREPHEMKDSGVEWLGMIPREWEVCQVKRFMISQKQGFYTTEDYVEDGIKLLRITDIADSSIINYNDAPKVKISKDERKIFSLKKGDFLFARSGTIGRFGLVEIDNDSIFASYLIRLRFKDINNYFLKYYFHSDKFKVFLYSNLHGGANKNIHAEDIKEAPLVIPVKEQQQKIINFLDLKCGEFDSIIEKKESLITKLEEAKKSLISEVVTGKVKVIEKENGSYEVMKREPHEMKDSGVEWLGMIPMEWEVSAIKHIANLGDKTLSEKEDQNLEMKYLDIGNVNSKGEILEWQDFKFKDAPSRARKILFEEDIIVSTVRTYLRAMAYITNIEENSICSTGFAILKARKDKIINKYLYYIVFSNMFVEEVVRNSTGVSYPAITSTKIMDLKICNSLNKDEQQKIADFLDLKCSQFDSTIEKQKELIEKLKKAKQSLISEAVTGKIEVL